MTTKQITDLLPADSFDGGDLLLIRKTSFGVDRNINYANFIKSISSSLVGGFVVQEEAVNQNAIILNHSSGVTLNKYYSGMKISFISPITSTDIIQIQIASLELVELLNLISRNPTVIKQGDYVEAIYSISEEGQGVFYCTNNYANNPKTMPIAEELPQAQPTSAPEGQAQQVLIPAALEPQEIIVTVGPNGRFKTIKLAIRALTAEYGEKGSNKPCIITLQNDYIIDDVINLRNMNLSWINITSTGFVAINIKDNEPVFNFADATSPTISAKFLVQKMNHFATTKNSEINFKSANFKLVNNDAFYGGAMVSARDSVINVESSTFDMNGNKNYFISDGASNNVYNFSNSQVDNLEGTFFYNGFATNDKTRLNIDNCQINSISITKRIIESTGAGNIRISNTIITGASSQLAYFYTNRPVTFKNCSITSSLPSAQSVVATGWSETAQITLDGGNYQTIVAEGRAIITLTNSPTIGNRSITSNGQIIGR